MMGILGPYSPFLVGGLGWPEMAQMSPSYRDQWFSHFTYPIGKENALKLPKSKCLIPALFILRYGAF